MKKLLPLFALSAAVLTACPQPKDTTAPSKPVLTFSKIAATASEVALFSVASGETFKASITNATDNVGITYARVVKIDGAAKQMAAGGNTTAATSEFNLKYDCPASSPAEVTITYAAEIFDAAENMTQSDQKTVNVICIPKAISK